MQKQHGGGNGDDGFVRALTANGPAMVCLTGSGGKTTLMFSLARQLAAKGAKVLVTTSTRIMRPGEEETEALLECDAPESIRLPDRPCVVTAARPNTGGGNPDHLRPFTASELDALWVSGIADWMLVEADGSAGRPLKAPVEKEPVIPSCCGIVVAVAGLSGLGKPFADAWVFRPQPFAALSGLAPGEVVGPEALARVIRHENGLFKGAPPHACRLVYLNQADLPGAEEAGRAVNEALLQLQGVPIRGVFMGSARDNTHQPLF